MEREREIANKKEGKDIYLDIVRIIFSFFRMYWCKYVELVQDCSSTGWHSLWWPDLGLNTDRRGGKRATNRLSYDTAIGADTRSQRDGV
jgi:hypothetical protein